VLKSKVAELEAAHADEARLLAGQQATAMASEMRAYRSHLSGERFLREKVSPFVCFNVCYYYFFVVSIKSFAYTPKTSLMFKGTALGRAAANFEPLPSTQRYR
jgi:hypothetical protein